jgi:carbonic anhydrase/acetyltransferase-like protein (isoleucine patch superfamily)
MLGFHFKKKSSHVPYLLRRTLTKGVETKALSSSENIDELPSMDDPKVANEYKQLLYAILSTLKSKEILPKESQTGSSLETTASSSPSSSQHLESFASLLAKKVAAIVLASQPSTSSPSQLPEIKDTIIATTTTGSSTSLGSPISLGSSISVTGLLTDEEIESIQKSLPSPEKCHSWYKKSRLHESLKHTTTLHEFIHPSATLIGDVTFHEHCSFFPNVVIRADVNSIRIGRCTNIQDNSVLHVSSLLPCTIGNNVTIGHNACIHASTIEDNVIIGMGSIVMDGAIIRQNTIIGAGTLITPSQTFPEMSLVMGRPGKAVRPLTEKSKNS